jgi:AraC family transcriptional regulator of adaptative response/methylated-DNA-[protein]-cysteine methyltransferase
LKGNFMSGTSMSSNAVQVFASDKERWGAVLHREATADGHFYYSVKTTGVYCRPTCSARRPRRENVSFHATPADAQQAGFRPCLRCRPDEPPLRQRQMAAVLRACRVIETAEEVPSLETLATSVGMSRFHLHRLFKAVVGVTPRAYAAEHRASRVRNELIRADSVTEAVYGAGFNSSGRFYASSSSILGMQPARFRSGGSGVEIRFAVGECSLGSVLVAATTKGVCAILLGDDPEVLVRDLQDRFPKAQLTGGDSSFENLVATVVGFVEAPTRALELPLDVRGTVFQQRVWSALREIPPGMTTTYSEIAKRIGAPRSQRAVAQACAANPIALAIPCHRVVRTDNSLSGYRWGIERKQTLLQREIAS